MRKVGIIGSGIGGMASAIRLASMGMQVEVFEANAYPGGKLTSIQNQDFRFDAGPSLFTMPQLIEDLFKKAQKPIKSYFEYIQLDEACRYFWEDGQRFIAPTDSKKLAQSISKNFNVDATIIEKKLKDSQRKYELTSSVFLEQSLHIFKNYLNLKVLRGIMNIPRLDIFRSMHRVNKKLKHPKLVQYFDRYATYNGSNPYEAPGILTSIPHLEHGIGTFFPKGGMHSITKGVYQLAMDLGVTFHFNHRVQRIQVKDKKAIGLKVNDTIHSFDNIISNVDVNPTYRYLLPNEKAPEQTLKQPKSSSALIFYWGIKQPFKELGLHNILFSDNYEKEFEHIFKQQIIYEDPTIYINITSKYESSDAPNNCENWFVMINVPHNQGQDWNQLIEQARLNIIKKINRILKVDLESLIVTENRLDPRSIETKTASHLGALYGSSSNNRIAAFLRHPNFSSTIKSLYFCGGSVHPGGGIPLCLYSAKIVSELIGQD